MRIIKNTEIEKAVASLCESTNIDLPASLSSCLEKAREEEKEPLARFALQGICENMHIASKNRIPVCQDTGMATVFIYKGEDVFIEGSIKEAVNKGVAKGYKELMRKSVVKDPLIRDNTGDNTPAVIHIEEEKGDKIRIVFAPKGFGSENKSIIKMMNPTSSPDDIAQAVADAVKTAGGSPCPPLVLGVGIGGNFEYCAYLAKKALCRDISKRNENEYYAALEEKIKDKVNETGVGALGLSGSITALAVNIEYYPTHIAGLPVAVNFGCHALRHGEIIL